MKIFKMGSKSDAETGCLVPGPVTQAFEARCCLRRVSPAGVSLTTLRPCSRLASEVRELHLFNPGIFYCSHQPNGELGAEVRHASITSS